MPLGIVGDLVNTIVNHMTFPQLESLHCAVDYFLLSVDYFLIRISISSLTETRLRWMSNATNFQLVSYLPSLFLCASTIKGLDSLYYGLPHHKLSF